MKGLAKALFLQGLNITLNEEDMKLLKEKEYRDFDFMKINGVLRVSITDREFSPRRWCEPGINVRRYPERISPSDYKGKQLWVIRLSRKRFEELLDPKSEQENSRSIISRCKYDRICINYFPD